MNKILLDNEEVIYTNDHLYFESNNMTFTDILGGVRKIRASQIISISPVQMNTQVVQWIKKHSS